jgi:hypothetical protein
VTSVLDIPLFLYHTAVSYRKNTALTRTYEGAFLICNCGEFHGMFNQEGLKELTLAILCFEVVVAGVPLSLLRLLELLLMILSLVQLAAASALACSLLVHGHAVVTFQQPHLKYYDNCHHHIALGTAVTTVLLLVAGLRARKEEHPAASGGGAQYYPPGGGGEGADGTERQLDQIAKALQPKKKGKKKGA